MQVAVESIHLLNRAIRLAPVDCIRHEKMRHPVKVQLGGQSPGGGLVLVSLHQDLPLGGFGQVRSVFGELIAWPGVAAGGGPLAVLGGSPPAADLHQAVGRRRAVGRLRAAH